MTVKSKAANVIQFRPTSLLEDESNPSSSVLTLDPEDFHVPASDSHGHSTRLQFRTPKQVRAMMMEIVQTKQFPYRSDSDLLRHAIVRHLRWLTDQGYLGANTIFTIEAILEVARDDENHQQFIGSLEKLEERVVFHRSRGSVEAAKKMMMRVKELVGKMPVGPWKEMYERELERRFPELIRSDTTPNHR